MTRGKKATSSKQARKLKVKKETLKDLGARGRDVKGGRPFLTFVDCVSNGVLTCAAGGCFAKG